MSEKKSLSCEILVVGGGGAGLAAAIEARMHNVLPNSRAYIHHLGKHAQKIGVEIRRNSRANKFLLENGRVVGARC